MSPLAHRLAKELTLPVSRRQRLVRKTRFAERLAGAVCFDLSEVEDLVETIAQKFRDGGIDGRRAFLPAPKTWVEFGAGAAEGKTFRRGYLLEEHADAEAATYCSILEGETEDGRLWLPTTDQDDEPGWLQLENYTLKEQWLPLNDSLSDNRSRRQLALNAVNKGRYSLEPFAMYAALAIINTPRLIGRKQHMPHRGLEKALLAHKKTIGRYPLQAWTEITLEATPRYIDDSGTEHEAHLTGRKCLHFCRAHLRVRNGQLEMVSSHWRGDPALGIKRTRYRVVA